MLCALRKRRMNLFSKLNEGSGCHTLWPLFTPLQTVKLLPPWRQVLWRWAALQAGIEGSGLTLAIIELVLHIKTHQHLFSAAAVDALMEVPASWCQLGHFYVNLLSSRSSPQSLRFSFLFINLFIHTGIVWSTTHSGQGPAVAAAVITELTFSVRSLLLC